MFTLLVVGFAGAVGGFVLGAIFGGKAKAEVAAIEARVKTLETTNTVATAVAAASKPKA